MTTNTLPRKEDETFADWTERFLEDADRRRIRELDLRVEAGRMADVNCYAIEG